jgi:hypothetical protein
MFATRPLAKERLGAVWSIAFKKPDSATGL